MRSQRWEQIEAASSCLVSHILIERIFFVPGLETELCFWFKGPELSEHIPQSRLGMDALEGLSNEGTFAIIGLLSLISQCDSVGRDGLIDGLRRHPASMSIGISSYWSDM